MAEPVHPLKLALAALALSGRRPCRRRRRGREAGDRACQPGQIASLQAVLRLVFVAAGRRAPPHYVDAFDFSKQCSLHLTYHVHGDRRQRGLAMLKLKQAYRAAGFEPPGDELPDYLPLMLEFAALAPDDAGASCSRSTASRSSSSARA